MKLLEITPEQRPAVAYVAANMREMDRREIFATRWGDDTEALVDQVLQCGAFAYVASLERPIAAIGASPIWPGVWSVWMFATDEIDKIGLSLTRLARRRIIPTLRSVGAHRVECRSLEGYDVANAWLESLGAKEEAKLLKYGRNGEDFRLYVLRD